MESDNEAPSVSLATKFARYYQMYLDRTVPYTVVRWIGTLIFYIIYFIRVFMLQVSVN